jgi:hypothetical protein
MIGALNHVLGTAVGLFYRLTEGELDTTSQLPPPSSLETNLGQITSAKSNGLMNF